MKRFIGFVTSCLVGAGRPLPGIVIAALTLAACSPEDPFLPKRDLPPPIANRAFIRVVNASSEGPSVTVKADTTSMFAGEAQSYLNFTGGNQAKYYPIDTATRILSFINTGGTTVASTPLLLRREAYYSAYLYGPPTDLKVLLTVDTITPPDKGSAKPVKLRVVHLSPDAPNLTLRFESLTAEPFAANVAYGSASSYQLSKSYEIGAGTSLHITDGTNLLFELAKGYVILPGGQTYTLLFSGNVYPSGDQRFLQFAAFPESAFDNRDSLYGFAPFRSALAALRFVNLVPSLHDTNRLDVTFYDPAAEFAANSGYRRTLYADQRFNFDLVRTLGAVAPDERRIYRQFGYNVGKDLRYRIEYHQEWQPGQPGGTNPYDYRIQDVFVAPSTFRFTENGRFTIVAYGPWSDPGQPSLGATATLTDNTPQPPAGSAQVRFFHGAFGDPYQGTRLSIRINGASHPASLSYGEAAPGPNSFSTAPGTPNVEVVDGGGNVIHTQMLGTSLEAGKTYTIFLSRSASGSSLYLHALSESIQ